MLIDVLGETKIAFHASPEEFDLLRLVASFKSTEVELMHRDPKTRWVHATFIKNDPFVKLIRKKKDLTLENLKNFVASVGHLV